jgi:hypothetical protein
MISRVSVCLIMCTGGDAELVSRREWEVYFPKTPKRETQRRSGRW